MAIAIPDLRLPSQAQSDSGTVDWYQVTLVAERASMVYVCVAGVQRETESWWGTSCCQLALKSSCQNTCRVVRQRTSLIQFLTINDLTVECCY